MVGDATNNSQSPAVYLPLQLYHYFISCLLLLKLTDLEPTGTQISSNKVQGWKVVKSWGGKMMDGSKPRERKNGPVKAAISSYGERILEGSPAMKNFQTYHPERHSTKTRQLHQTKMDSSQLNQSRKQAESVAMEAESELSAAKKTVKELGLRIEESNLRTKSQIQDIERLKMAKRREGELNNGNSQYAKVMSELESIKQELSKLKLDMASILQEKRKAEQEIDSARLNMQYHSSSVETLTRQIEEINEEHVFIELAKIEAIKEYGEIEAQRKETNERYLAAMEKTRKKKNKMIQEIENAKELENRLAITVSEISELESELKQVNEMEKVIERNESWRYESDTPEDGENLGDASLLNSLTNELEATKKELTSIKEDSFQFMASMDIVRNELKHVAEETSRLKKKEEKSEMIIQNLNSKLLRAKAKLEAMSAAEDKAKSIVSNLSLTLEQLNSESETAKKERSLISEETAIIKAEVQKIETEIDLAEERLQAAFQELKAVKSSEAMALENLKSQIEITMRNRASASQRSSTITISKFEYEYLIGQAAGAKEIADKKVAAAEAWIKALKASEKEIMIKTELLRRENRELKVEEDREVHKTERSLRAKKTVEKELENRRQKHEQKMDPESLRPKISLPIKAMNRSFKMTPATKQKSRRALSPEGHYTSRATSFTVRRRKKMIPNLAKFFSGRSAEKNHV